jgi:hypothetical protein
MNLRNPALIVLTLAVVGVGSRPLRAGGAPEVTDAASELTVTLVRWPYT